MNKPRLRQFLALFLVLCMLCSTTLPIYAESSTREVVPVETAVSVATPESSASESSTEKSSDPIDTSLLTSATAETSLSEAAQAFVDAVAALDREEILSAINAWGLASQAWQADKSNAELTAALDAATEASDVVAAPVYAAEDLYLALSDEEREIEAVKTAYSSLTALIISMQLAMQNPTAPGESSSEPELDEISTVLYGDLPDAPTGSYIGEYGLPVATGDTKISISAWKNDLLDASSRGRLDAVALNEENAVMSVAKQDGTDYAIVPIAVQVEYPANGATSTITLPDTVELLSYTSTSDNLVIANAHVLTENKGGTLIDLGNEIVSLDIFRQAQEKYAEGNLFRNNPWYSTVVWEKRDALTGGLVDASAEYEIQEWDPKAGEYKKSTHYQVVRRDDGKYTVNLIGDAFFPGWEGKQGVLYYHQANEGKYRIVELKAPASYNLKAWEHDNWVIGWSEEIVVHPDHPSYEFLGETAAYNMPYKTKVLIKKVDDDSGEFILPETTWTLYEWNERNNQYEVSTNYKIVRREDGYYTVTTLHSDWTHYEEGYLYYEDTQTDYSDSGRWFSNQGKFLIVESKAPAGYYGDYWRNDEPGTHSTDNGSDLGKRGYAFTLTEDNGTLWLTKTSLEDIFRTFNLDRPADFTGHSLSVSDIVVLNRGGDTKAYYCDSAGFVDVPSFLEQKIETAVDQPIINEDEIRRALCDGSGFENGKMRIQYYFSQPVLPPREETIRWLKKEYGTGGRSWDFANGSRGWLDYNNKGFEIQCKTDNGRVSHTLTWQEVSSRLQALVQSDHYLSDEERPEYEEWLSDRQAEQAQKASDLEQAKEWIRDYCRTNNFDQPDFEDLRHIDLAYSSTGEGDHSINVYVDLLHHKIVYNVDGERILSAQYASTAELVEHELSGVTFDELIGTAEQEYRERQREQAIRSAPQKRPCIAGDIVYLENDKAFIVQDIGEGEILLQDQELPLFSRSVSREEFSRLLERNERNKHLQAPAFSDTANAARWLEDDWLLRAADCAGCKQKGPTRCAPRRHHLPGKKGQSRKAGKAGRQTDRPGMAGRKGSLDRGRSGHRAVSGQRVQHRRGTAKAHRAAPGDAHGLR